ncbi:IQ domain-containing protein E-like isoform X1 [Mytilus trossulus]|uniref:IQ domain-containing protein E-like isoform X1 n=1 Tax=Mytilus trossulus TaxID=6551 RepID=UPI00300469A3
MKTTEMPKSRVYQLDEYESGSDIDNTETLLSKHFSQPSTKKKKGSNKKSGKQKETPRKRAQSAPPAKVGRDLWMNAVKKRQTQNLTRSRPESPRHKTSTEYWVDTLRKTGIGRSTESTGMNTFSGKRPREQDMAYLSTSAYMRQMMGAEKPQKYGDPTTKPPIGAPAYKTPEEYYDQVLELKKIIQGLNQEKNELKSKVRRTEEDNIKKEKEISGLLDPKKSDDVRRTLGTKQQDSASVIHSLKQKILKLEVQNRDRESAYVKLQTDLKTTKIDELKQQLEVCFQEIVRLQNSKGTGQGSGPVKPGTDKRVKALNEAILRLSKENEQLKSESHGLKEDLNRQIDDKDIAGEYEDMNRKQLIAAIKKIEKQKPKTEKTYKADKQGKIALQGSMEERLDQLDKRETELMDKVETQGRQITKLQHEKESLYRKLDDKEKIIVELEEQTGRRTSRSPTTPGRPPSGRRDRPSSARSDGSGEYNVRGERPSSVRGERPSSVRSVRAESRPHSGRSDRSSREREEKVERLRQQHAAKKIQRGWRTKKGEDEKERDVKVQKFKENRAAKKIQNEWTGYKHRKYEADYDEAADTITAALKGHQSRQQRIHKFQYYDESETEDESLTDATELIYSSLKGHNNRKDKMKRMRRVSDEDEDFSSSRRASKTSHSRQHTPPNRMRPGSAHSRASNSSQRSANRHTGKTNYRMASDYDDDDDIEM